MLTFANGLTINMWEVDWLPPRMGLFLTADWRLRRALASASGLREMLAPSRSAPYSRPRDIESLTNIAQNGIMTIAKIAKIPAPPPRLRPPANIENHIT